MHTGHVDVTLILSQYPAPGMGRWACCSARAATEVADGADSGACPDGVGADGALPVFCVSVSWNHSSGGPCVQAPRIIRTDLLHDIVSEYGV